MKISPLKVWRAVFWISIASVLAACGDEPAPVAQPQSASKPQTVRAADPTAKMARAFTSGKGGAAIDLKYEVLGKPEVGKPLDVELAFVPSAEIDSLSVTVTASPGIEVMTNATGNYNSFKIGAIAAHKITVRAERADVGYLTIIATTHSVNLSSARTFTIPLIISGPGGAPTASANATTDAQSKSDATGQKVQSMPAQESK